MSAKIDSESLECLTDCIDGAIEENLRNGYFAKAGKNANGEQLYRLTEKGKAWVESKFARRAAPRSGERRR